ncbi:sigma-70 family RNA polymerase sigma factor [Nocardioides caricicola]|uniref:Sigma-70 family RNA polymerase sigma factor n=1 Tax=Nocardioides caricicola TaxID=634770 RepID=A0ABW0N5K5_9ACTN
MTTHTAPTEPLARDDADELAVRYLPIVGYLVRETMSRVPSYVDEDSLHSAGNLALVAAARAFDPARGVPFDRYASTRIRGAIVDELRSVDWASRSVRRRSRELADARARLTATGGGTPGDAVVARELGVSVDEVVKIDADVARATVLPLETGPDFSYADTLHAPGDGPEASALNTERLEYLVDAIAELPDRLATVVRGYFLEERPMAEIAAELGVTESRISQLRAEALVLLRDALNAALHPELLAVPETRPAGVVGRRRAAYADAVAERHAQRAVRPSRRARQVATV